MFNHFLYFFLRFYLFLERGEVSEKERKENIEILIIYLSHTLSWGPGPQPRHVP